MADPQNAEPLDARADEDGFHSDFNADSANTSLTSLRSSIREHRRENGRRYHALSEGSYILPNDEKEQERLDINHHLWELTWDGKLCMCPKNDGAKRVLDVGTGTGIWAIEFADEHPDATVVGVDLSPIQPGNVPPNCTFELDDVDKKWTWSIPFDFIFVRHMNACFASWEKMIAQAYENLEPGGYLELQDNAFPLDCRDGTLKPDSALARWSSVIMQGTAAMGRPVTVPAIFKKMLEDAGFENVVEERRVWPINSWPADRRLQELGHWSQFDSLEGVEASTLALCTRVLDWTREETLVFCSEVRNELKDRRIHALWNVYCAYGRKPLKEPDTAT